MAELTHKEIVCLQVEDFSGCFKSFDTKKSSKPAPRVEPSRRRRVAASRRRAHARVPRAAGVPPPTHQERGPRLAHATCVSEEPGRMGGKCQNILSASVFTIDPQTSSRRGATTRSVLTTAG